MDNVMIDLETLSTDNDAAIVSIGAVMFDNLTIGSEFYITIDAESCEKLGLTISASTVKWWMSQENKTDTFKGTCSLPTALVALSDWLPDDVKVWCNGVDFDSVILTNAYKACGLILPWKYYNSRCYRTVKNLAPDIALKRIGLAHNALDDAMSQANHLANICNVIGIPL